MSCVVRNEFETMSSSGAIEIAAYSQRKTLEAMPPAVTFGRRRGAPPFGRPVLRPSRPSDCASAVLGVIVAVIRRASVRPGAGAW